MIGFLVDGAPSVALLLFLGVIGVAVLRRSRLGLTTLECVAYGVPAGIVAMSLVMLGLAIALGGLSASLVLGSAVASVIGGIALWPHHAPPLAQADDGSTAIGPARQEQESAGARIRHALRRVAWVPVVLFAAVAVEQAYFWSHALRFTSQGLVSDQQNVYGDWGMHLGDVTSFLWGDNFPPMHPRLAGASFSYHYLSSFTAAAVSTLGINPVLSMTSQSFLFMLFIVLGLYAFGRRVIGSRFAALLVVPLFLLGGGYGWVPMLRRLHLSLTDPFQVFHEQVFNRQLLRETGYPLPNPEYMFQAQRGYLYGVPLALLTISLLLMAVRQIHQRTTTDPGPAHLTLDPQTRWLSRWWMLIWGDRPTGHEIWLFAGAGLAAGIIPIGHFSTVYALMLAMPAIALLSMVVWPIPSATRFRRSFVPLAMGWALFGLIWVALTVPQVLWVYGDQLGAGSALRIQWGWMAGHEAWWRFWLKNAGSLAILLPIALVTRGILDGITRRFLLGFSAIFVLSNVFAFLPWDWNNALFLQYWLLSAAVLVAALLARAWTRWRTREVAHVALTAMFLSVIGLGLLVDLNLATANDRWVLLDPGELTLAARIRQETPPDAVFVTGQQYDNPIAVYTGRRLVLGYTTWLWTQGLDFATQQRDVQTIMKYGPGTPALLAKYHVDYVAIGPWALTHLHANTAAFGESYPRAIHAGTWSVFAISRRAISALPYPSITKVPQPAPTQMVPVTEDQRDGSIPSIAWSALPSGPAPDQATVAAIETTFHQMDAIVQAGKCHRIQPVGAPPFRSATCDQMFAFYSQDFYRRPWAIWQRKVNGPWTWDPDNGRTFGGMRTLPDGRVGVVYHDPAPGAGIFVVMAQRGGRWLVDEYLAVTPSGQSFAG